MWKTLLCVGAGSFVGGMARYGLTRWVSAGNFTHLPLGTMVVNVAGCLFIGLLYGWFERADVLSPEWRLFLTVGFCGGFTTFSTFVHENYILFLSDKFWSFAAYAVLSFALGCWPCGSAIFWCVFSDLRPEDTRLSILDVNLFRRFPRKGLLLLRLNMKGK